MNIIKKSENQTLTLTVEGRLDSQTAPELDAVVKNELAGVTLLTIDMEKLDYISSAGLRVLLSAQKIMNKQGQMEILHINEVIQEIFEVTGFVDILTIR